MGATVTRLSARRGPHLVAVPAQALAESAIEVTLAAVQVADLLARLAAANRDRPAFVREVERSERGIRDLLATGRWLATVADNPKRAA